MRGPPKADSVLIVDPNAVLPGTITRQRLETIAGRNPQIFQRSRDFQLTHLSIHHSFKSDETPHAKACSEPFGILVPERRDYSNAFRY